MLRSIAFAAVLSFLSFSMIGCESTQHRHGSNMTCCADCSDCAKDCGDNCKCSNESCSAEGGSCCGSCGGKQAKACDHKNAPLACKNCKPGKACCSGCETKMAKACPDCNTNT